MSTSTNTAGKTRTVESIRIVRDVTTDSNFVYYHYQAMGHFVDEFGMIIPGSNFSLTDEVGCSDRDPGLPATYKGQGSVETDSFNSSAYTGQKLVGYEINATEKVFDAPIQAAKMYVFYNVMYVVNEWPDKNLTKNKFVGGLTRFQSQYNSGLACMIVDLDPNEKDPVFKLSYSNLTNVPGEGGASPHP